VCEVLSPGHEAHDRQRKRPIYAEGGVPYLWVVSPEERTLEAFALKNGAWMLLGTWTDGAIVRIPPFEAIELPVGRLFTPRRR
jgi:Uma2 family endonuclease